MQRMFGMTLVLLDEKNKKDFERQYERIERYETIADNMEMEIAKYLEQVGNEHLSDDTKEKIRIMFRQICEFESIGDACFKIACNIKQLHENREDFTSTQYANIHNMMHLVNESLTQMMVIVNGRRDDLTIDASQDIEYDINNLRDKLKTESINEVNTQQYSYNIGITYNNIIATCEKLGDYVMNVVEARLGKRYIKWQGLQMNLDRKIVTIDNMPVSLTRTEFDLLQMLLTNRGHVLSRKQLMESLWSDVIVTDRTVNVHITRLRKKLGIYAKNIVSRPGFGYVFEE
jgi:phosphate:Na+ symporter